MPDYLFSPLTYAVILVICLPLGWRYLPRWARFVGLGFEILLLLMMTPLGANVLVWSVESRLPASPQCRTPVPTTIVLLSGGTDRVPRSPTDYGSLDISSLRRLFAAVALWQRTSNAHLVIAGGGYHVPESVLLAGLAENLGVQPSSIEIERRSHTTWENALNVAALRPVVPRRIWLVSSALHLPRALGAFRAWGFEPCVYPSASIYVSLRWRIGYFIPQSSALVKTESAIHELIGAAVYAGLEWKLRRGDDSARSAGLHAPPPESASHGIARADH